MFGLACPLLEFGRGLRNMARRAETLGGRLRIASQPGDGAQILVEVPLQLSETGIPKP